MCLSIDKMTRKVWIPHIQLTEVPKAYFTTIKARKAEGKMEFYDNLLQVTICNNGMVFDLDSTPIKEVDSIEGIDQLMKPDTYVNTGFIMSISHNLPAGEERALKRVQIITNEYCNLLFEKQQTRFEGSAKRKLKISGMLYRTFAELDLRELNGVMEALDARNKVSGFDPEAILSSYEGHTILSIFFDRIEVYALILGQL